MPLKLFDSWTPPGPVGEVTAFPNHTAGFGEGTFRSGDTKGMKGKGKKAKLGEEERCKRVRGGEGKEEGSIHALLFSHYLLVCHHVVMSATCAVTQRYHI